MKFKNMTDKMVILRKDKKNDKGKVVGYSFYDCNPGDVVDVSEIEGSNLGFMRVDVDLEIVKDAIDEPVKEEVVEEVEDNSEYEEMLRNINGIGKKTVEDILAEFPTENMLRHAIENEAHLPFRNDVVNKLIRVFGE